ncbi:MAG: AAA family ATPase [Nostoc sp.]|uniref:AAA family ATPase n=1 Tax=Nostoc sp. TaxID=1180 RepID=UPI002FF1FCF4
MHISQQRLHKLEIKKLKNIKDLCISFEMKNITGILGPNGYGKSTILHALACCFQPPNEDQENYKFSNFFLPNPDALWEGSELTLFHTYRQASQLHENVKQPYGKSSDRWKPIYKRRPIRNVHYFGVDSCVPLIEAEKRNVKINYSTSNVSEDIITTILEKASFCLNKQYTAYNIHDPGKGKKFIGVEANGIRYSALSMSAGEQKIFILLEKVFRAIKYSLILIDELDLLLHDSAMKNLIKVISQRAQSYNLQVVFTTHRESIIELSDLINIRHIFGTSEKTFCFNETKPDAINRLTGSQPRLIEVFVEDDLAVAIIKKIAGQLGISRHVSIQRFGAAINSFTVLAGLLLRGESCENSIFVLDGDVYKTKEEQEKCLKAVLTGDDEKAKLLRQSSLEKIKCLNLPENIKPEKYIHSIIINLQEIIDNECNEIIGVAKEIVAVDNSHKYVDDIISRLDWDRGAGLSKIVDLVSSTQDWVNYIANVKDWLTSQISLVQEVTSQEV